MTTNPKQGKILFIDDQKDAVEPYIQHLREEGFTNVDLITDVKSLNQVLQAKADIVFLDIAGVASSLGGGEEGLSVLDYLKKHSPWTRVIVLSGSDFPASKAKPLSQADLCITKASLNLAELVNLAEDQLKHAVSPEYRNARVLSEIAKQIDDMNLGWYKKWKLQKLIVEAQKHEGDPAHDWQGLAKRTRETLSTVTNAATIIAALVG